MVPEARIEQSNSAQSQSKSPAWPWFVTVPFHVSVGHSSQLAATYLSGPYYKDLCKAYIRDLHCLKPKRPKIRK